MATGSVTPPTWAARLGWAGVVPFAAGTVFALVLPLGPAVLALSAVLAYGAAILSFLGGVRWGLAVAQVGGPATPARWINAVLPALVGWIANMMALAPGLALLTLAFVAAYFFDAAAVRDGEAPRWYGALRRPLSAVVVACLGTAFVVLIVRFSGFHAA